MNRSVRDYNGVYVGYTVYSVDEAGRLQVETFASKEHAEEGRTPGRDDERVILQTWSVFLRVNLERCPDAEPGDSECVVECHSQEAADLVEEMFLVEIERYAPK